MLVVVGIICAKLLCHLRKDWLLSPWPAVPSSAGAFSFHPVVHHISRVSFWGHFQALFLGLSPGALSCPLLSQDALSGQQHPQWGCGGKLLYPTACQLLCAGNFKELRAFAFGAEPLEVPLMTDLHALMWRCLIQTAVLSALTQFFGCHGNVCLSCFCHFHLALTEHLIGAEYSATS